LPEHGYARAANERASRHDANGTSSLRSTKGRISDVAILGEALVAHCRDNDATALASYSERALRRVWRAEHFSWWMTSMLHRPPDGRRGSPAPSEPVRCRPQ
jgi:hypothetical protein